jgi:stalled ribosome alternative rescue factor ArfA
MPVTSDAKGRARPKKRAGRKMKKTVKRRSAPAAALATPLYRKRVVKSAKAYSRKAKAPAPEDQGE